MQIQKPTCVELVVCEEMAAGPIVVASQRKMAHGSGVRDLVHVGEPIQHVVNRPRGTKKAIESEERRLTVVVNRSCV